jgi:hypothetical protein
MTVYVDQFPWGDGKWGGGGHMLGHAFAGRLGLRRSWFQGDTTFAHYDLTASKRKLALEKGATHIEMGEIPDDVLVRCKDGTPQLYEAVCG